MDANFIELFLESLQDVFLKMFHCDITRQTISVWNNSMSDNDIAIITGVTGYNRTGIIVYSMRSDTAKQLIQSWVPDFVDFDDLLYDGLGELVNIISGNTMKKFADNNIDVSITTPSLIAGNQFEMHLLNQATLSANMQSRLGSIEVKFAIKKF